VPFSLVRCEPEGVKVHLALQDKPQRDCRLRRVPAMPPLHGVIGKVANDRNALAR
jgi:hypothetical protein